MGEVSRSRARGATHSNQQELARLVELLEAENFSLRRKLYGVAHEGVVLSDEQYLSALLRTKTFRWTRMPRKVWGVILFMLASIRS